MLPTVVWVLWVFTIATGVYVPLDGYERIEDCKAAQERLVIALRAGMTARNENRPQATRYPCFPHEFDPRPK